MQNSRVASSLHHHPSILRLEVYQILGGKVLGGVVLGLVFEHAGADTLWAVSIAVAVFSAGWLLAWGTLPFKAYWAKIFQMMSPPKKATNA